VDVVTHALKGSSTQPQCTCWLPTTPDGSFTLTSVHVTLILLNPASSISPDILMRHPLVMLRVADLMLKTVSHNQQAPC
jgi:hypothetical protein